MREAFFPVDDSQFSFRPFYTPFSTILLKADTKDPDIIYIEASNENPDIENDVLFQKALEEEAESFLKKGLISWDHLHKLEKNPEYIIGEPLDVSFKEAGTWVKGKLYKAVRYAKAVKDLLESGSTRIGASVGGFIKKRKELAKSGNEILKGIFKVIWDEIALTYKPVNDTTMGNVSLIPIGAFAKALMAGTGVDPTTMFGGRAMTKESLQGSKVELESIMKEFVWRLRNGDIKTGEDIQDFLSHRKASHLYGALKKVLIQKFNSTRR